MMAQQAAPSTELRFDAVTVRFGHGRHEFTAVDTADLVVPAGKVVGLVGESGCGKSTLARAALGLVPLSGGQILLDGTPLPAKLSAPERHSLQMVFQDPYSSLDPRMTIGESVAEAIPRGALTGTVDETDRKSGASAGAIGRKAARRAEVARLLELVELAPDRARQVPAQLSGGQRQRVALARALAARPSVITADEITSALDVSVQGTVLNLLRDLQRQMQLTMLFISHNLAVVRYVSDIVAVMYRSEIVECGPADTLLADPQHPYTRELLAAAPRPDTRLTDEVAGDAVGDAVDDAADEPPTAAPGTDRANDTSHERSAL